MLSYRDTFSFLINVIWLNKGLMRDMYTSIPKEAMLGLGLKCTQSITLHFISDSNMMFWPLTTIGAARLHAPFFTLLLAYIFLKE